MKITGIVRGVVEVIVLIVVVINFYELTFLSVSQNVKEGNSSSDKN